MPTYSNLMDFNKCLFIKAEAFHDFAGKSIGTTDITGSNMAERLSSDRDTNLTKALSKNIGTTCGDLANFKTLPILKDTKDEDQITNLTFNNFNYAQTLQTTGYYYSTLKNSVVQSKQGGKVPQIHSGRGWLRDISTNEWKDYNVNTKDGLSTVKVFHLEQNKTQAGLVKGANQYGNEVMKIFQHCVSARKSL